MSALLGFDTATPVTTAAVLLTDGRAVEAHDEPPPESRGRHASRLLVLIERVLGEAGVGWDDVGRLAVGVGPGGFTGLRIGIATARALAQARGWDVVPVGSLEALAAGAYGAVAAPSGPVGAASGPVAAGSGTVAAGSGPLTAPTGPLAAPTGRRPVAAVIDARRGEVFTAVYGVGGEVLLAPGTLAPAALARHFASLPASPLAVGDGAIRFAHELASAGAAVPAAGAPVHRLSAVQICRLGVGREAADRDALLPMYLREPDAKPSVMT